jgi:DnaJ-class molecular chaperone
MGVEKTCAMCGGDGYVTAGRDGRGRPIEKTCPQCEGDGYIGFTRPTPVCAFFCPIMKAVKA